MTTYPTGKVAVGSAPREAPHSPTRPDLIPPQYLSQCSALDSTKLLSRRGAASPRAKALAMRAVAGPSTDRGTFPFSLGEVRLIGVSLRNAATR